MADMQGSGSPTAREVVRRTALRIAISGTSLGVSVAAGLVAGKSSPVAALVSAAGAVLISGLVAILGHPREPQPEPEDPDSSIKGRVAELSSALVASSTNLEAAAALLADLQRELSGRQKALENLQKQIIVHENLAKINKEAAETLEGVIESKMRQQERNIVRVAWGQGVVFAIFGATIAVLVVIFAHFIPVIK